MPEDAFQKKILSFWNLTKWWTFRDYTEVCTQITGSEQTPPKCHVSITLKPCQCLLLIHTDNESPILQLLCEIWSLVAFFSQLFHAQRGTSLSSPPSSLSPALCQGTGAHCAQSSNPIMKQSCVTRLPWQNQWKQYSRVPLYTHYWGKDRRPYFKGKCQRSSQQSTVWWGFKIEPELRPEELDWQKSFPTGIMLILP